MKQINKQKIMVEEGRLKAVHLRIFVPFVIISNTPIL